MEKRYSRNVHGWFKPETVKKYQSWSSEHVCVYFLIIYTRSISHNRRQVSLQVLKTFMFSIAWETFVGQTNPLIFNSLLREISSQDFWDFWTPRGSFVGNDALPLHYGRVNFYGNVQPTCRFIVRLAILK